MTGWLVVEPTQLKNMRKSNRIISPKNRGKNKKYLSCHHLVLANLCTSYNRKVVSITLKAQSNQNHHPLVAGNHRENPNQIKRGSRRVNPTGGAKIIPKRPRSKPCGCMATTDERC